MRIADSRAIVTGGASGIGFHAAQEIVQAGGSVAAFDTDQAGLQNLVQQLSGFPERVRPFVADVSDERAVAACVAEASSWLVGVNTLINSAGILRDGLLVEQRSDWVKKLPASQWRRVLETNLTGPFLMTREVAGCIMARGGKEESIVVNISSASRIGHAGQSNYSASKAGLDACTRTWAQELAKYRIRVCGIAPGLVETPMLNSVSRESLDALRAGILLGNLGQVGDVWLAIRFAVECSFFNGKVIEVDGGASF